MERNELNDKKNECLKEASELADTNEASTKACDIPFVVDSDKFEQVERVNRLMNEIWKALPECDQAMIQEHMRSSGTCVVIQVDNEWPHRRETNAMISLGKYAIIIDGGYIDAADDEHVSATLVHELAHLRGWAFDEKSGLSEELTVETQLNWGFGYGEVVFQNEACRYANAVLHSENIEGQFFWLADWDTFIFLPNGEQLQLREDCYLWLDDNPWSSLRCLLSGIFECDMPFETVGDSNGRVSDVTRRRMAWWSEFEAMLQTRKESWDELEKSEQCKKWKEELTEITERTMPEDNW